MMGWKVDSNTVSMTKTYSSKLNSIFSEPPRVGTGSRILPR